MTMQRGLSTKWTMLAALTALAMGPGCGDDQGESSNRNPLLEDAEEHTGGRPPTPVTGMTTYDRSAAVPGFAVGISLGGPTGEDVVLDWSGTGFTGSVTIYRSTDPVALRDLVLGGPVPAGVVATPVSGVTSWADAGAASRTVQTPHYYYRVALGGGGGGGGGNGEAAYLRADGYAPWGQTTNEAAMDLAFGAGAWDDLRFQTADVDSLFSSQYSFVFLEGGDSNASELETFVANNIVEIEQWVDNGGTLFINAAPNEGGSQAWGFGGVTLNYPDFPSDPGHAVDAGHPIWEGPFTPIATSFTGNSYAHATVSGPGLVAHILDADGGNPNLAELGWGMGRAMFGGLTTTNWWSPTNEALNLRANIIDYLAEGAGSAPQLSTMVMKTTTATAPGFNRFGLCMLDGPQTASEVYAQLGAGVLGVHQWNADTQSYVSWTPGGGAADFPLLYGSAVVAQFDGSAQAYHSLVGVVPTNEALAVTGEPGYNWTTLPVFYDGPTSTAYWVETVGYWGVGEWHNDTQTSTFDWNDPGYPAFDMESCGAYDLYLPNNACTSNADCGEGTFCYFVEPASCGEVAAGLCMPQPLGCEGAPASPVCGCDGQTYDSQCAADLAGVSVRRPEACPPAEAACGDGNIDPGEQCDGENLGDATCVSEGFDGGTLGCTADCTLDTAACTNGGGVCEPGQDVVAVALAACQAEYTYCDVVNGGVVGHDGVGTGSNCGTPAHPWRFYCTEDSDGGNYNCSACSVGEVLGAHDPCNCNPGTSPVLGSFCDAPTPVCGDGNVDPGEQCDGGDLGGATCASQGFAGGTLGCTADCTFDTGACTNGDGGGVCEGQDPVALALAACQAEYTNCDVVSGGVVGHDGVGTGSNCGTPAHPWRFYCTEDSDGGNYNCSACSVGEVLGAHDPCNCNPGTSPVLGSFCDGDGGGGGGGGNADCGNPNGGPLAWDNGTGTGGTYCYDADDTVQELAQKACESHFGEGNCCIITGGYQDQQYGQCGADGWGGSIHWHWDNHPAGHCAPFYVVGDVVTPGWCGAVSGNFLPG